MISKRNIVVSIILFLTSLSSYANKIEKGFEALNNFNYFEAKEIFYATLKKQISPSAYGLASIFSKNDNPFYELDSAYKYICISEKMYSLMDEKEKIKLKKFNFEYLSIIELRSKISSLCFSITLKTNSIAAYNEFINKHEWSNERFSAIHKRDSIGLYDAKSENSAKAYNYFLTTFTNSEFESEATKLFQISQYREQTNQGTITSYLNFIKQFPNNPHVKEAEDRIFELSTHENTIPEYITFIKTYPTNRNVGHAWKKLYQVYMYDYSDARIIQFQQDYPEYPYKNDLEKDLKLSKLKLLPFKKNSLFGYMDFDGNIVIDAEYEALGFFQEGLAYALKNGKYGYIDKANNLIIDYKYSSASDFEDGRAIVEIKDKVGIIDRSGLVIFDMIYEDLGTFSEGLIYALKDSLYGYYDKIGVKRIDTKFNEAFAFNKGIAKVQTNENQAFIDLYGSYIVPPAYSNIHFFTDSLLVFEENEKFGLMKRNCQIIDSAIFEEIGILINDRAVVIKDGKIGYIDGKGQLILDCKFDNYPNAIEISQFKGSYAVVSLKGKFGVIEQFGKFIIPPTYNHLGAFSPLMAFDKGKGWGFIDMSNNVLIQPQFEYAESFKNGFAMVEKLTLFGLIDVKGNITIPLNFTEIKQLDNDRIIVSRGPNFGVYKVTGEEIVPVEYQQIRIINKDLLLLSKSGEVHYLFIPENKLIIPKITNE
ncbi:MAG: WG repeat-containing protein [Flavobacteriia bacterium]|nr:WG repeat-containing protein [Flavobacteriia bacterium]